MSVDDTWFRHHSAELELKRQAPKLMAVNRDWRALLTPLSRSWVAVQQPPPRYVPAKVPENRSQTASLAENQDSFRRMSRYESVTLEDRSAYFEVSCRPITKKVGAPMHVHHPATAPLFGRRPPRHGASPLIRQPIHP